MKVGEILIKQGVLEEQSIIDALSIQGLTKKNIGEILVNAGTLKKEALHEALAFQKVLETDRYENKAIFLETIPPFNGLPRAEIEMIAETMAWATFLPKSPIVSPSDDVGSFYVIRNGLVKSYLEKDGKEVVIGFLGECEYFGEISILSQSPGHTKYETLEHTFCLIQNKADFLSMVHRHPAFSDYFHQIISQKVNKIYKEMISCNTPLTPIQSSLYRRQVKDMVSSFPVFCNPKSTARDAAKQLLEKNLDALIVADDTESIKGILAHKDIVKAILLEGQDSSQPVEKMMEKKFNTVEAESFIFDALHHMIKHKTNRLIVTHKGKPVGLLTTLDILKSKGIEVLSLIKNIEAAPSIAALNEARSDVDKVLMTLMNEGALASHVCKILSEFNDKMVKKVLQLAEKELGRPPVRYAWLALGSEGRKEQTLLTDQDNAIIYTGARDQEAEAYFRHFSEKVVNGLNDIGFPLCKGNIMATNQTYFGCLDEWKERTAEWVMNSPVPEKDIMDIYVFLDFRAVSGDRCLETKLKSHIIELIKQKRAFTRSLSDAITSQPMPLGFFKNFIVKKDGKYKNTLDIKLFGLLPLTTCIKILAYHSGIFETNTLERIGLLKKNKTIDRDLAEFLEQSFETFLTLKIRNDINDKDRGRDFSNRIDPATLTTRQKHLLKEAFLAVSRLQQTTQNVMNL
jgi:CBS domain-containing protein